MRLFKDGTQIGSASMSNNFSEAGAFYIGHDGAYSTSGLGDLDGYIDELRIVKGSALYTANFSPPTAEAASSTNNLTVQSTALSAASTPSSMKVVARVKEVDSITLNTDFKIAVSRDGGTTFSDAALNDRFTVNSIHVLESNPIDVSSAPAGTSVKWKITTANNKMVETHDIYVYWS